MANATPCKINHIELDIIIAKSSQNHSSLFYLQFSNLYQKLIYLFKFTNYLYIT